MYVDEVKTKLLGYRNIADKKNKTISSKIKLIPSHRAFRKTMYKLGISQTRKQFARLIIDNSDFHKPDFTLNNTIKLSKENIVFEDFIDERKFKIPKGKTVEVYTRRLREGIHSSRRTVLEVAFLLDEKIFVINKE